MKRFFSMVVVAMALQSCGAHKADQSAAKAIDNAPYANAYSWTCYLVTGFQHLSSSARLSDPLDTRRVCVGNYNANYNYVLFDNGQDKNDGLVYFGASVPSGIRTPGARAYSVRLVNSTAGAYQSAPYASAIQTGLRVAYNAMDAAPEMLVTDGSGKMSKLNLQKLEGTYDDELLLELRKRIAQGAAGQ